MGLEPKKIKNMKEKAIMGRVQKMIALRNEYEKDIENVHVRL